MASSGRFVQIHTSNDNDVDVSLFLSHFGLDLAVVFTCVLTASLSSKTESFINERRCPNSDIWSFCIRLSFSFQLSQMNIRSLLESWFIFNYRLFTLRTFSGAGIWEWFSWLILLIAQELSVKLWTRAAVLSESSTGRGFAFKLTGWLLAGLSVSVIDQSLTSLCLPPFVWFLNLQAGCCSGLRQVLSGWCHPGACRSPWKPSSWFSASTFQGMGFRTRHSTHPCNRRVLGTPQIGSGWLEYNLKQVCLRCGCNWESLSLINLIPLDLRKEHVKEGDLRTSIT